MRHSPAARSPVNHWMEALMFVRRALRVKIKGAALSEMQRSKLLAGGLMVRTTYDIDPLVQRQHVSYMWRSKVISASA